MNFEQTKKATGTRATEGSHGASGRTARGTPSWPLDCQGPPPGPQPAPQPAGAHAWGRRPHQPLGAPPHSRQAPLRRSWWRFHPRHRHHYPHPGPCPGSGVPETRADSGWGWQRPAGPQSCPWGSRWRGQWVAPPGRAQGAGLPLTPPQNRLPLPLQGLAQAPTHPLEGPTPSWGRAQVQAGKPRWPAGPRWSSPRHRPAAGRPGARPPSQGRQGGPPLQGAPDPPASPCRHHPRQRRDGETLPTSPCALWRPRHAGSGADGHGGGTGSAATGSCQTPTAARPT